MTDKTDYREEKDFINKVYGLGNMDHATALQKGHIYHLMREFTLKKHNEKKILQDFIMNFDWKIRGNHALTTTCARITDKQKELIENIVAETILESKK